MLVLVVGSFKCYMRRVWSGNSERTPGKKGLCCVTWRSPIDHYNENIQVKLESNYIEFNVDCYPGVGLLLANSREIKTVKQSQCEFSCRDEEFQKHQSRKAANMASSFHQKDIMPCNCLLQNFLVSKESDVLRWWRVTQKLGWITAVKNLESWRFER